MKRKKIIALDKKDQPYAIIIEGDGIVSEKTRKSRTRKFIE